MGVNFSQPDGGTTKVRAVYCTCYARVAKAGFPFREDRKATKQAPTRNRTKGRSLLVAAISEARN